MESEFASMGGGDHFIVEDLLDFSNVTTAASVVDDVTATTTTTTTGGASNSSTSSTAVDDVTSAVSSNGGGPQFAFNGGGGGGEVTFSADLCVPSDDLAELEWLSNFVEESFSSEDLHKLQLLPGVNSAFKTNKIRPESESDPKYEQSSQILYYHPDPIQPINNGPNPVFNSDLAVPGKARSKRSRAAPGNWTSRLLLLSSGPGPDLARPEPVHGSTPKPVKSVLKKKSGPRSRSGHELPNGEARRCLHCATDKTPQWRTGPLGPKTLCNACGVRYKSGRLVPEYRPAASPTFVMTKHSNSHRKVMELRRQKDLHKQHQLIIQHQQRQQQLMHDPNNMIFDPPNTDDYLIHQHIGPDFRQLI